MKPWRLLLVLALLVAALSPFASSLPDGLEYTAVHLGFAHRAAPAGPRPLLPDYALPGHERSAAASAGVGAAGALVVFVLAYGLGEVLARRHREGQGR